MITIKYYVHNMLWGYFMAAWVFYFCYGDHDPRIIALQILSLVSAILFPFSKFLIANIALKYTKKSFWETGLFKDGVPKTYLMTLYIIFIYAISIPVGVISIFVEIKKAIARR